MWENEKRSQYKSENICEHFSSLSFFFFQERSKKYCLVNKDRYHKLNHRILNVYQFNIHDEKKIDII